MTEDNKEESVAETFISHLVELRDRLVRAGGAVLLLFVCMMPWSAQVYDILANPMMAALPVGSKMIATGVLTPFMVPLKVTLLAAFVITLPWVLYQAWAFIAPGLYAHEKKLVAPLVVSSTLLFYAGIAFCYFFVFNVVFKVIYEWAPKSINVAPDIESYFDFALTMFICFGLTFEVPIVVVVLVRMGLISVEKLKEFRPYIIVGAFIVAAIVTPPDATSMLMLAIPLWLLFEVGLLAAPLFVKMTTAPEEESA